MSQFENNLPQNFLSYKAKGLQNMVFPERNTGTGTGHIKASKPYFPVDQKSSKIHLAIVFQVNESP